MSQAPQGARRLARLSAIDHICLAADTWRRPLDYTLILHLRQDPGAEALAAGARSAGLRYPTSRGRAAQGWWLWHEAAPEPGPRWTVDGPAEQRSALERWSAAPLDPRTGPPLAQLQLLRRDRDGLCLATHGHHALADFSGAAAWLAHQLQVAFGQRAALARPARHQAPRLRRPARRARKSPWAFARPSDRLWSRPARAERARSWRHLSLNAEDLRARCGPAAGFTYNDLLTAVFMQVFAAWNREHGRRGRPRVGIWLPVDIREHAFAGFGNGASRIRVYDRCPSDAPLAALARSVRQQVTWCKAEGEWALPSARAEGLLPRLDSRLLRAWLNRPWADMCTAPFTHVERWAPAVGPVFEDRVERLDCIMPLDERYSLAIAGFSLAGRTDLSLTYDPARLRETDVAQLAERIAAAFERARRELPCAPA